MAEKKKVKTDVVLKDFWRQNERFADLFNAVVFQGKEVLKPEALQEMDTDLSGIIRFKDYEESLVRTRDVVKKMAFGVEFAVLGIEAQQRIHYAMPLRTLLYDGMGYLKEYQQISRSRKTEAGSMTEDEFLSGMCREDRLHPIISIVVYYSEHIWDGPMCLKDMIVEMPEEIERIFADYKMNLVQVRESDQYVFHNEDVKTVFEVSREIFKGNFDKIRTKYRDKEIKSELITVIGKITDSAELMRQGSSQEVNMCTALERLKEEGRQEGREENIRDLVLEWTKDGYSVQEIAKLLKRPEEFVKKIQDESPILV
ncbi:MAG: hypothetical protein Q4C77_20010 [Eubacteriales bacterium]|nr:hypothetical protein [Eubacteriales bacterium]